MMREWYYVSEGQQAGPVPEDTLRMHVQTGTIKSTDHVWTEGMADWAPAGSVPEFAGLCPSVPEVGPQVVPSAQPVATTLVRPHRGTAVLVLGILSLVIVCCGILGIIAWVMGSNDLREMRAGRMDRSGYGITQAGWICGIIGTILGLLQVVFFIIYVIFVGTMISSVGSM